ncbi:MAG: hypothetical protein ACLFU4_07950 [Opitutales bacterium]
MELANIGFVLLCIKLAIGVIPFALGIFFIATEEEKKRAMRAWLCNRLFGVSNAIPYPNFARTLTVAGILMMLFGLVATWFLVIAPIVEKSQ